MPEIEKTAETTLSQEPSNEVTANYSEVDEVADINKQEEDVNDVAACNCCTYGCFWEER